MQYTPTRVRPKPVRFHISAHVPAKNAPDFTFPNRDTPKTYPVLDPNPWRRTFRGVCFCAPTRVRPKSVRFHISAHGYTKNVPGFIFLNRDAPKPRPVLHPNRRRVFFRGVCNRPLHGYAKNPPGFRPKPSARIVWGRMQYAPTRVHAKFVRFHIPAHGYTKNAPGFIFSNRDTPKTRPVLYPNLWRGTFGGVCLCAPTRVHTKFGGFHISAPGYPKNAPDFIIPN